MNIVSAGDRGLSTVDAAVLIWGGLGVLTLWALRHAARKAIRLLPDTLADLGD